MLLLCNTKFFCSSSDAWTNSFHGDPLLSSQTYGWVAADVPWVCKPLSNGKALWGSKGLSARRCITLGHRSEAQKGGWILILAFSLVVPSSL